MGRQRRERLLHHPYIQRFWKRNPNNSNRYGSLSQAIKKPENPEASITIYDKLKISGFSGIQKILWTYASGSSEGDSS